MSTGIAARDALGTGRRKTSVARVRVRAGNGTITVNGRTLDDYFDSETDRRNVMSALEATQKAGAVDVIIQVHGGGISGQSGAIKLGIARALKQLDTELAPDPGCRPLVPMRRPG
jgi:small subunit ribosomal protein S9